jgi:hypothetical protein
VCVRVHVCTCVWISDSLLGDDGMPLVAEPARAQRIAIAFEKRSKRIDVKLLKKSIWQELVRARVLRTLSAIAVVVRTPIVCVRAQAPAFSNEQAHAEIAVPDADDNAGATGAAGERCVRACVVMPVCVSAAAHWCAQLRVISPPAASHSAAWAASATSVTCWR